MKFEPFAGLSIAAALFGPSAHAAVGRLPTGVVPTAYELMIDPDATKLTFSGSGSVAITVAKPTRTITVNAADLSIRNVIEAAELPDTIESVRREHSRKPCEMRTLIDTLLPHEHACELFAREPWAGRDVWGNQTDRFGAVA